MLITPADQVSGALPTGTVTFLFTDIQGSTPLWEQHPEAMKLAVAVHHTALREAIAAQSGVVFKVIGDAFQASFALPSRALAAAIAAQKALSAAEWPALVGPLKVRMGLHVGPAEIERTPTGSDYAVSHTLNRVARIMSTGHGGQILLSREAADLIERDLPADVSLTDLGEHHLKGLNRPEHLYQVRTPGLPNDFPPLSAGLAAAHNLPAALTSFIGREAELESLQHLIAAGSTRLVTLTGPGGTGKTRLALQAGAGLLDLFADGIWLVELAPLADPALIAQTVADVLGVRESPGKSYTQVLIEHLRAKRLLLILDNCEHVVDSAATLAGHLLQGCQRLQVLATSREILGTMGETPFRVPSLGLPSTTSTLAELASCESIRLFVERAGTAQPGFALTEANAPLVRRICQRLDGIPLAIELAAARVRVLTVDEIAARLDDSFRLLTGGSRTVLSRHQTLRALIDWSYNLLTAPERTLFQRLSVFAGGFTLAAAESVCADAEVLHPDAILDLLAQLVDKSLVIPFDGGGGVAQPTGAQETRYRLLETIRQYARDRLHDAGSGAAVRDRHLTFFVTLAEAAEPHLRGAQQVAWLDRLDAELDNARLALEWALATQVGPGLRLAAALFWFWHIRGHRNEGVDWLGQLLDAQAQGADLAKREHALIRGQALTVAGFLIQFQSRPDRAQAFLQQAIACLSATGPAGRHWLGVARLTSAKLIRDRAERRAALELAYPLLRESGDRLYLAEYTMDLGGLLTEENDTAAATAVFLESLALREACQDLDGIGTACLALGDLALFKHDFEECRRRYGRGLECYRVVKNRMMESILLSRLGQIDMLTGDMTQAASRFSARIALSQKSGDRVSLTSSLFDLARLELNIGESYRAGQRFADIARIGVEIHSQEAVLVGLLFQGLAAREMNDSVQVEAFAEQAIAFWRAAGHGAFDPGFAGDCLENLGVLLSERQPDVAARLFTAIDTRGFTRHELNTPREVATYAAARAAVRAALGESRYAAITTTEPLTLEAAVAEALAVTMA
ncbi:MAG: adenylate/guanylate cyclase domain-containing protein [Anaerolineales bacterium]|nr:adenylate/guanylate cyclase domain-containing protein [Anaerolineales bacterium]